MSLDQESLDQDTDGHLVPAADSTANVKTRDVAGNKGDAAQTTVGTTRSIMAYIKGVLNQLAVLIGYHTVPSADAVTNAQLRDVAGNKSDTVAGTSLVSIGKQVKAKTDLIVSGGATESNVTTKVTDVEGTNFVKDIHSLKNIKDLINALNTALTFQHQSDAVLSQAAPNSETKYTVLDTTLNVRLISVAAIVTWTVQPTPLDIWITVDGHTLRGYVSNPVSAGAYCFVFRTSSQDDQTPLSDEATPSYRAFLLEGRSVKVEVSVTGGTVSNLSARVKYASR